MNIRRKTVRKFINFLSQNRVIAEFDDGLKFSDAGISIVEFTYLLEHEPKNFIIDAIKLGAISEKRAHHWNELSDKWREVLSNG